MAEALKNFSRCKQGEGTFNGPTIVHRTALADDRRTDFQPIGWLLLYFVVVFFGAALLAPWIYLTAQAAAREISALEPIASQPFHRYVNRCLILLGAAGLWPLLRAVGLNSWGAVGLKWTDQPTKRFGQGFLIGLISLAIAAALAIGAGTRVWESRSAPEFAGHIAGAVATAVFVACLEELLFRGALFGALRKAISWQSALAASSAVYAILHFFERPAPPESVSWFTGLVVLGQMCRGFADWQMLVPGFMNLTLVGGILAMAYQRIGTLYFSIGLHAGWIFWLKSYGFMTDGVEGAGSWFWGSRKLIDGWLSMIVLLIVWWLVRRVAADGRNEAGATSDTIAEKQSD